MSGLWIQSTPDRTGGRKGVLLVALCAALFGSSTAEEPEPADESELRRELAEVKQKLEALERRLGEGPAGEGEPEGRDDETGGVSFTPFWERDSLETPAALRGLYDKPFLAGLWRRAYVGGYTEIEYHSFEDGIQGIPEGFRMHRTNLFLFTDISDQVRFGSELEFETEFEGGANSSDIEVALEMAFVDWTIYEELSLRGGVILPPLGRINVNHDGPVRELTERPLVSTYVIPTTLSEVGVGAHGSVEILEPVVVSYEAYVVNGFNVLQADGSIAGGVDPVTERERILREGRSSLGGDINDGVATTGRLALELAGALELGGSWHFGTYDERGDNFLTVFAGDVALVGDLSLPGLPLEGALEGEIAVADFARDAFATSAGIPEVFWGYYVQASVGGLPDALRRSAPFLFGGDGARFGLVLRYDWIDLDGDRGEVIEPGINFRPVGDTVFKFSYRFTPNSFGLRGVPGTETFDDEGFVFSITTYF